MQANSAANSRPASRPPASVPSRSNSAMPRQRAQSQTSSAAAERARRRLPERRDLGQRDLRGDLVQAPEEAAAEQRADGQRIEVGLAVRHRCASSAASIARQDAQRQRAQRAGDQRRSHARAARSRCPSRSPTRSGAPHGASISDLETQTGGEDRADQPARPRTAPRQAAARRRRRRRAARRTAAVVRQIRPHQQAELRQRPGRRPRPRPSRAATPAAAPSAATSAAPARLAARCKRAAVHRRGAQRAPGLARAQRRLPVERVRCDARTSVTATASDAETGGQPDPAHARPAVNAASIEHRAPQREHRVALRAPARPGRTASAARPGAPGAGRGAARGRRRAAALPTPARQQPGASARCSSAMLPTLSSRPAMRRGCARAPGTARRTRRPSCRRRCA